MNYKNNTFILSKFLHLVHESGLSNFIYLFGDETYNEFDYRNTLGLLNGKLKILVEVFLLNLPFKENDLVSYIGEDVFKRFLELSIIKFDPGKNAYRATAHLKVKNGVFYFSISDKFINAQDWYLSEVLNLMPRFSCSKSIISIYSTYGIELLCLNNFVKDARLTCHTYHSYTKILQANFELYNLKVKIITDLKSISTQKYDLIIALPPFTPIDAKQSMKYDFGTKGNKGVLDTLNLCNNLTDRGSIFIASAINTSNQNISSIRKLFAESFFGVLFLTSNYKLAPGIGSNMFNSYVWQWSILYEKDVVNASKVLNDFLNRNNINFSYLFSATLRKRKDKKTKLNVYELYNKYTASWML